MQLHWGWDTQPRCVGLCPHVLLSPRPYIPRSPAQPCHATLCVPVPWLAAHIRASVALSQPHCVDLCPCVPIPAMLCQPGSLCLASLHRPLPPSQPYCPTRVSLSPASPHSPLSLCPCPVSSHSPLSPCPRPHPTAESRGPGDVPSPGTVTAIVPTLASAPGSQPKAGVTARLGKLRQGAAGWDLFRQLEWSRGRVGARPSAVPVGTVASRHRHPPGVSPQGHHGSPGTARVQPAPHRAHVDPHTTVPSANGDPRVSPSCAGLWGSAPGVPGQKWGTGRVTPWCSRVPHVGVPVSPTRGGRRWGGAWSVGGCGGFTSRVPEVAVGGPHPGDLPGHTAPTLPFRPPPPHWGTRTQACGCPPSTRDVPPGPPHRAGGLGGGGARR